MAHRGKGLIANFWDFFASANKVFILVGGEPWAIILWSLDTFLIFPNFLRFLSRSATREAARIYYVYK